jgi:hypothetical protein
MPVNQSRAEEYTIRRLQPDDAEGVVNCVRGVYGDSYLIHTELYHPEQIVKLNEVGSLISVVALDENGQVVAHYALERPDLKSVVAESGEAMVLPEHQHHHLLERMRVLLEAEAERLGLVGIFGRTVTNHLFSQMAVERFGELPCGVSLGRTPKTFRNMQETLPQRMSIVFYFKYLRQPKPIALHVPARHQDICRRIYDQFGVSVSLADSVQPTDNGQIEVDYHSELQRATIRVRRCGQDTSEEIRKLGRELCDQGAEVIFLELPLSDSGTPEVGAGAEGNGFFFCGIGPSLLPEGDAIRMQCLSVKLDPSLLQIKNPFARELLSYVDNERRRVGVIALQ